MWDAVVWVSWYAIRPSLLRCVWGLGVHLALGRYGRVIRRLEWLQVQSFLGFISVPASPWDPALMGGFGWLALQANSDAGFCGLEGFDFSS